TMQSGLRYTINQVAKIGASFEFSRDVLAGGYQSTTQTVHASFEGRTGLRQSYRVVGEMREVGFLDGFPERSYVALVGWTYGLTQRTGVEIIAGPRLTDGTIQPEITAMLRRRLRRAELSAGYWRTSLVMIGQRGTVDTQRFAGVLNLHPLKRVTM